MTTNDTDKQTEPLHSPNLILDVENFGPIAQAKNIEFKPLTVFVGPSNTGKTYLAVLNHAVLKTIERPFTLSSNFLRFYQKVSERRSQIRALIVDLATHIQSNQTADDDSTRQISLSSLTKDSRSFFEEFSLEYFEQFRHDIIGNITDYFEIPKISDIISTNSHYIMPILRVHQQDGSVDLINRVLEHDILSRQFTISDDLMRSLTLLDRFEYDNLHDDLAFYVSVAIWTFIRQGITTVGDSYYFPIGRTGIMNAHRVLTSQIIANAGRHGMDQRQQINYHRLAREFLNLLVDVDQHRVKASRIDSPDVQSASATESPPEKVARILEESLIGGDIRVIRSIGLPDFEYSQNGSSIPVFRASSMVTELAPIIMFLRSFVTNGDLLIIDEPEAHLHPAAQQQMAAALAFMVRSGLRVLITTHSHYMVEQLSAFVNASKLDPATRKRTLALGGALGEEDIYLNEEETAVYNFRLSEEHGGSVVEEVFMGDEYEYGTDDHSDAVTDQFNRLQRVLEARERLEAGELD